MEREDTHEMAVVGLVKMNAGKERVSLPDTLTYLYSHSRGKSDDHAFAGAGRILHHIQWLHHTATNQPKRRVQSLGELSTISKSCTSFPCGAICTPRLLSTLSAS